MSLRSELLTPTHAPLHQSGGSDEIPLDSLAAPSDGVALDASTTAHGLLVKATAPSAGIINVVAIANGETVYTNKALFDATVPAAPGTAATGSATVAARRDHVHPLTLPRGYIDGLIMSDAADTEHDITISVGACRDSTNASDLVLAAAITKRIDAAWAAGDGNGGIDTGSVGNSTWYHVYVIKKDSDGSIDALFSTNVSSPTMPAGYTYKRRIGSVLTNGSANIQQFRQFEGKFLYNVSMQDIFGSALSTSGALYTLSTPLGVKTQPIIAAFAVLTTGYPLLLLSSPDVNNEDPASAGFDWHANATANNTVTHSVMYGAHLTTNTSSQIRGRTNSASVTLYVETYGWIDPRGTDA